MARWLQLLWGVSGLHWSVSIKSGPRKEQWWTGNRVMGRQDSLMRSGREGWPLWSDSNRQATVAKIKLMPALIERCQNTQCITVCCVWGCIAADLSGCPCWPLSTTQSTNNGHVSIRTGPQSNERKWPGLMNHFFSSTSCGWLGACASKKASRLRHCDALGMLGNLGSFHPCGCYFDMYHLPKHCCRPCTPFHGNSIPWWLWPLSAG